MFCIRCAVVIEKLIVGADLSIDFIHVFFYNSRKLFIIFVRSFFCLEEDVRVLSGTFLVWVFRVHRVFAELSDRIHISHVFQGFGIPSGNLLVFVRGSESVKEMQERNFPFDCRQMSNSAQVHNFLWIGGSQHRKTGLTACINVLMVAKDAQRMGSQCTGRNVDNARKQLPCDFIHIRDHEQQALRSSVSGSQRTSRQRAVNCTGSTSFRLHFYDLDRFPKNVFHTRSSPFISDFCHVGRRSNRVDCSDFSKGIRNMSGSGITIHSFHFSCHEFFLLKTSMRKVSTFSFFFILTLLKPVVNSYVVDISC